MVQVIYPNREKNQKSDRSVKLLRLAQIFEPNLRYRIREYVHIYVSETFFLTKEVSKTFFNFDGEIEQHACWFIFKKWPQPSRPHGIFYRKR